MLSVRRGTPTRIILRMAAMWLAFATGASLLVAQGPRGGRGREGGAGQGHGPGGGRGMGPGMHGEGRMMRRGLGFFRHLRELSPQEQERLLASSPRFQRLPAMRQQMIRERLKQWNALGSEQKERIHEREEIFMSLSPAQRQEARTIFPRWRNLEPERRQALMQAFRRMRDLPLGERTKFLESEQLKERLSPEEREILSGMGQLLPPGGEESSGEQPDTED